MKTFGLILVSSILIFSSCTKTVTNPAPVPTVDTLIIRDTLVIRDTIALQELHPIVGLWIGSQIPGDGSTTIPLYYSFNIKSNNTILVAGSGADGNTYYAIGTWSLTGTSFTATITVSNLSQAGAKQNISATYNSNDGTLTSGAITSIGYPYSATFTMDRID
ncbi:MAG: hypothetical protein ABIY90_03650 [Puia sp.]